MGQAQVAMLAAASRLSPASLVAYSRELLQACFLNFSILLKGMHAAVM